VDGRATQVGRQVEGYIMHSAWALMNEVFMLISAGFAAVGWYQIRKKNVAVHRRLMITSAIFGGLFFVSYALGTVILGDVAFGGPAKWAHPYQVFLQVHVILATIGGLMLAGTLWLGLRAAFRIHRRIAPWTAVLWFVSAGTGLVVYLMLFVIFPHGPVANVLQLILHHSKR
jgi:putative membrane protein